MIPAVQGVALQRARRPLGLLAALTLLGALAALTASTSGAATPTVTGVSAPSCFGAAARDPLAPCVNPALNFTAIPRPSDAALEPSAPCTPNRGSSPPVCHFGVPQQNAPSTVALMGDSHSTHWRAALAVVAATRRWHGVSIDRSNCPFTFARTPGRGRCAGWSGSVVRWLQAHPEVHSIFVSANSGSGVVPLPGMTRRTTKMNGYIRAWKALPRSVRHIFVIRDVPHSRNDTRDCVTRAVARHRNPAQRCARPRSGALRTDWQAVAAGQTDSERVKLIDLTRLMCDDDRCFPVVGGALVIKDIGHLTRTFSTTLGPFLGRAIARLQTPSS